jgi:hypothetical protein
MTTISELISRISTSHADRDRVTAIYEHTLGFRIPQAPFPATIVGIVHPMPGQREREWANSKLSATPGPCDDPAGLDECFGSESTPDARGFYAEEFLPCGIAPVRYRWVSSSGPGHSEGCGYRLAGGELVTWRQAFYAVNVAHGSADGAISPQDRDVDYGPAPGQDSPNEYPFCPSYLGLPVIMAFGYIGHLTNDTPKWGFFFTHSHDPVGVAPCAASPDPPTNNPWCCYYVNPLPPNQLLCVTVPGPTRPEAAIQCASYSGTYTLQGHNPGTPGTSCTC